MVVTETTAFTLTSTSITTTTYEEAITITVQKRRALPTAASEFSPDALTDDAHENLLEERDVIVVSGRKPSYATNCKNVQQYGELPSRVRCI